MYGKRRLQKYLSSARIAPLWTLPLSGAVTIFMMHRFALPELGVPGHSPDVVRRTLARLRREGYKLVDLRETLAGLRDGSGPARRSVAFTIDDGYSDVGAVAADVFMEYDCPVTVFLTTGFVDGTLWQWWDQLSYILTTTRVRSLDAPLAGGLHRIIPGDAASRLRAAGQLAEACKRVPDAEKHRFIRTLAAAAEVEFPRACPPAYRSLDWDQVRALESRGFGFGPHTVTHPILPQTSNAQAAWEIGESWRVVSAQLARPAPIFAYPNGDHGPREVEMVGRSGLTGTVTATPGYASRGYSSHHLPRFPFPEHEDEACFIASGFSRLSTTVRQLFLPKLQVSHAR